ncbi:unnamed protein product [Nyctereutes procyonoides]|uniref:(raccoon dog) hypothetical protein n=1 Tax=Nyctereutes procyonoides TaxID=34880 RepID=A0A811ZMX3_NYCPR|nr:unnamed protein product [Nyctereutes procyonoides]
MVKAETKPGATLSRPLSRDVPQVVAEWGPEKLGGRSGTPSPGRLQAGGLRPSVWRWAGGFRQDRQPDSPPRADAGTDGAGAGAGLAGPRAGGGGSRRRRRRRRRRRPGGRVPSGTWAPERRPGGRGGRRRGARPPSRSCCGPGGGRWPLPRTAGPWLPRPLHGRFQLVCPGRLRDVPRGALPSRGCAVAPGRREVLTPGVSGACPFPRSLSALGGEGTGGPGVCPESWRPLPCLARPRRGTSGGKGRRVLPPPPPPLPRPRRGSGYTLRCGPRPSAWAAGTEHSIRSWPGRFPSLIHFLSAKMRAVTPQLRGERPRIPTWHLWETLTVQGTTEGSQ